MHATNLQPAQRQPTHRDSTARFAWLLSPDATPAAPCADLVEAEAACQFGQSAWKVLPDLLPRLERWAVGVLGDSKHWTETCDRAVAARSLGELQTEYQLRLANALTQRGVPHCFLKGSALRLTHYPDRDARCGYDIDVGVPRQALLEAEEVALELGFQPAEGFHEEPWFRPADPERRAHVEDQHYELGFLVRRVRVNGLHPDVEACIRRQLSARTSWHQLPDGTLGCYLMVDIHHGISHEIRVDTLVEECRQAALDGAYVAVPRPAWALLHLVYKLYWEGVGEYGKGMYQLVDLCRLAPTLDDVELAYFARMLEAFHLEAAGYFVLRRLPADLGMNVSPAMLELIDELSVPNPSVGAIDQNDLGDMWPKLFGERGTPIY